MNDYSTEKCTDKIRFKHNLEEFTFSSDFRNIYDVNPNIYKILASGEVYIVISDISRSTFLSFINNWITGETPIISSENIDEFEYLSDEFDRMKDLIQLYRMHQPDFIQNRSLHYRQLILSKMEKLKLDLSKEKDNWEKNIDSLIQNNQNFAFLNDPTIKSDLHMSCIKSENIFVYLLTRPQVPYDDISYVIDTKSKQSGIFNGAYAKGDYLFPKSIIVENQEEFPLTNIYPDCFVEAELNSIEFPLDSELRTIYNYAFSRSAIKRIKFPSSLICIKEGAFSNTNLEEIEFPENSKLEVIEKMAFASTSLEKVVFPSSLKEIDDCAFIGCRNLKIIDFQKNSKLKIIGEDAFSANKISHITLPSCVEQFVNGWCICIDHIEIQECEEVNLKHYENTEFILTKSNLNSNDFDTLLYAPYNVKNFVVPSFIKYIHPYAFNGCTKLEKIEFVNDSKLVSIGSSAFNCNVSLLNIKIPPRVQKIGNCAFKDCTSLQIVEFDENSELKIIGKKAFEKTLIRSISIPSSVVVISESAFSNCVKLINIEINNDTHLERIGDYAFDKTRLSSISIPSNMRNLSFGCFINAVFLTKINVIPRNNVENIKFVDNMYLLGKTDLKSDIFDALLYVRRNATEVTIPSYITDVVSYSFNQCRVLRKIEFNSDSKLKRFHSKALYYSSVVAIKFPNNDFKLADGWFVGAVNLRRVCCYEQKTARYFFNGDLLIGKINDDDNDFNRLLFASRGIVVANIPKYVKVIAKFSFARCLFLKKVLFDDNSKLEEIGSFAFSENKFTDIVIPVSVKKIDNSAFSKSFIEKIFLSDESQLKSIEANAFEYSRINSIFIPSKVNHIGKNAFFLCRKLKIVEVADDINLLELDIAVFGGSSIELITIPQRMAYILTSFKSSSQ